MNTAELQKLIPLLSDQYTRAEVLTNIIFSSRTILCNSLVWSCSVTGKTNLTYEEAVESERKAKKRLGTLPKPLKRGLLWLTDHTQRGKLSDLVDDVWRFASGRYFKNEVVEAIVNEQWCDCKVINVKPPTQQEIDKDAEEEREEQLKADSESPSKTKKSKKSFFPPEHLFKYELEEIEPDEDLAAVSNVLFTLIFASKLTVFFIPYAIWHCL